MVCETSCSGVNQTPDGQIKWNIGHIKQGNWYDIVYR